MVRMACGLAGTTRMLSKPRMPNFQMHGSNGQMGKVKWLCFLGEM